MNTNKNCYNLAIIIVLMLELCTKGEGTCGHRHRTTKAPKYNVETTTLEIFDPATEETHKSHVPSANLKTIIIRPKSVTTPPPTPASVIVHNEVVNGNSYIYNIQNYGKHYHSYDFNDKDKSTPHTINLSPLEKRGNTVNDKREKSEWDSDVEPIK